MIQVQIHFYKCVGVATCQKPLTSFGVRPQEKWTKNIVSDENVNLPLFFLITITVQLARFVLITTTVSTSAVNNESKDFVSMSSFLAAGFLGRN